MKLSDWSITFFHPKLSYFSISDSNNKFTILVRIFLGEISQISEENRCTDIPYQKWYSIGRDFGLGLTWCDGHD